METYPTNWALSTPESEKLCKRPRQRFWRKSSWLWNNGSKGNKNDSESRFQPSKIASNNHANRSNPPRPSQSTRSTANSNSFKRESTKSKPNSTITESSWPDPKESIKKSNHKRSNPNKTTTTITTTSTTMKTKICNLTCHELLNKGTKDILLIVCVLRYLSLFFVVRPIKIDKNYAFFWDSIFFFSIIELYWIS